jgi:hypothetical protein
MGVLTTIVIVLIGFFPGCPIPRPEPKPKPKPKVKIQTYWLAEHENRVCTPNKILFNSKYEL